MKVTYRRQPHFSEATQKPHKDHDSNLPGNERLPQLDQLELSPTPTPSEWAEIRGSVVRAKHFPLAHCFSVAATTALWGALGYLVGGSSLPVAVALGSAGAAFSTFVEVNDFREHKTEPDGFFGG